MLSKCVTPGKGDGTGQPVLWGQPRGKLRVWGAGKKRRGPVHAMKGWAAWWATRAGAEVLRDCASCAFAFC